MRNVTLKAYRYSELEERAQERAKQDHAAACGYAWAGEAMDSIKALAEHFDGRMQNWSIDWFDSSHSSAEFDMPEMDREEIAERLSQLGTYDAKTLKGHGDCKLTGYCGDEDAIDGFRAAFFGGESDHLAELMQSAFDSWLKAAQADCEAQYSDDNFSENCDANGYEFYDDGSMV